VISEKFTGSNDNDTFKNWVHSYGYEDRKLNDILAKSHGYLETFLRGEQKSELKRLGNLFKRWNISYTPVKEKSKKYEFW